MKWFVIAFALFTSAVIVAVPASADRKGAPTAQAKAAAKAQAKAAKQARAEQKKALKQELAAAKAELKQAKATVKQDKALLLKATRDVMRLDKSIATAQKALSEAVRTRQAQKWSDQSVAAVEQAQTSLDGLKAQRPTLTDARFDANSLLFNAKAQRQKAMDAKAAAKLAVKKGPPPVGQPAFSRAGVLQLKAIDFDAYAVAPALGPLLYGPAPLSGSVAPPEPAPPAILPPPASASKRPPEPPPPEPPLSRTALTIARAESPYQIIPMSVFKQNANEAARPAPAN